MPDAEYTPEIPTKQCSKCKAILPATLDYFPKRPRHRSKDCLDCQCLVCRRKASKTWKANNRLHVSTYNATYHATHTAYEQQRGQAWYQANIEANQQKARAYAKEHLEERLIIESRRRARKATAPQNDLTTAQWKAIQAHYKHRCIYCGIKPRKLTMDHLTPISKGGSHTVSNIVPACKECNFKKHAGPPLAPVQPLLCL